MSTETSVPRPRDASSSALADLLVQLAPVGIALVGSDLRFRRVNAALARIVGVPEAGHVGQPLAEVWPEELAARAEAAVRKVLADGEPLTEPGYPGEAVASWFIVPGADGEAPGVGLVLAKSGGAGAAEELPGQAPDALPGQLGPADSIGEPGRQVHALPSRLPRH